MHNKYVHRKANKVTIHKTDAKVLGLMGEIKNVHT